MSSYKVALLTGSLMIMAAAAQAESGFLEYTPTIIPPHRAAEHVIPAPRPQNSAQPQAAPQCQTAQPVIPVGSEADCGFSVCEGVSVSTKGVGSSSVGIPAQYHFVNLRPVLNGFFYRFGARNPKNKKEDGNGEPYLDEADRAQSVQELCKLGFTHVFSANRNFKDHDLRCADGRVMHYASVDPDDGGASYKTKVIPVIDTCLKTGMDKCRIGVHCTNGEHRAGEMAAFTLMHYCGYSVGRAKTYWEDRETDEPVAHYEKQMMSFARIRPSQSPLDMPQMRGLREALCPSGNGQYNVSQCLPKMTNVRSPAAVESESQR